MKCPKCGYQNGYNTVFEKVEGEFGDFELSTEASDELLLVICPSCKTEFIP